MTGDQMTPEESDAAIQASLNNINRMFQDSLRAAGIENAEQYILSLEGPAPQLDAEEFGSIMLTVADIADTISSQLEAAPEDSPQRIVNRLIAGMLEPTEEDRCLDMGWTFETAAMHACAVTLLALHDPHRKITTWVDEHLTNEDGAWRFTDPTHGDATTAVAVLALLDMIWPEWKN